MSPKVQKKTKQVPSSKKKSSQKSIDKKSVAVADVLFKFGVVLVALSLVLFLVIFYPTIMSEVRYLFSSKDAQIYVNRAIESEDRDNKDELIPVDTDFGIVVPKIKANASVIRDVDPYNSKEYQYALTKGVAHAKGSALPGELGNVFLFAHSSDSFYNANRYNSVFYLLKKLEFGDQFYILKDQKVYEYEVFDSKIVSADEVHYITSSEFDQQATLMTCWPPGTTINRLIVKGKLLNISHASTE